MKRLCFLLLLFSTGLAARDIDLDAIYITASKTGLYNQLVTAKSTLYERAGSTIIANGVIFAHWLNGHEIVYIREFTGENIVYRYTIGTGSIRELCRIRGVITYSRCSSSGSFLVMKVLVLNGRDVPTGLRLIIDTEKGETSSTPVVNAFQDFTMGPDGDSVIYQDNGLIEIWPASGGKTIIANRNDVIQVAQNGSSTMGLLSPNRKNFLFFSGSGGNYRASVRGVYNRSVDGVSSASEIDWLDNRRILLRRGSPGYFSIDIFDCADGSSRSILAGSLHTNMMFSRPSGMVAMLYDGIICLYDAATGVTFLSGLEGEDVALSPDGSRFLSLYRKTLYCTHRSLLEKKQLEIRRGGSAILSLYRALQYRKDAWDNEYTGEYLTRKIRRYQEVTREGIVK